jgi:hypothetical protein
VVLTYELQSKGGPGGEGLSEEIHDVVKTSSEQRKTRKQRLQVCSATASPAPTHGQLRSLRRAVLPLTVPCLLHLLSTPDVTGGRNREQTPGWLGFWARRPLRLI